MTKSIFYLLATLSLILITSCNSDSEGLDFPASYVYSSTSLNDKKILVFTENENYIDIDSQGSFANIEKSLDDYYNTLTTLSFITIEQIDVLDNTQLQIKAVINGVSQTNIIDYNYDNGVLQVSDPLLNETLSYEGNQFVVCIEMAAYTQQETNPSDEFIIDLNYCSGTTAKNKIISLIQSKEFMSLDSLGVYFLDMGYVKN